MSRRWFQQSWVILFFCIVFFPLGLVLMWEYADWKKKTKVLVTTVYVALLCMSLPLQAYILDSALASPSSSSAAVTENTSPPSTNAAREEKTTFATADTAATTATTTTTTTATTAPVTTTAAPAQQRSTIPTTQRQTTTTQKKTSQPKVLSFTLHLQENAITRENAGTEIILLAH